MTSTATQIRRALVGTALAICAAAAIAVPAASAHSTWVDDHFVNGARTIECKGYSTADGVAVVCGNQSSNVGIVARTGVALTSPYTSGVFHFGRTAHILRNERWTGWGVTCRAGGSWVQCYNGAGHGIVIGRTSIQTF